MHLLVLSAFRLPAASRLSMTVLRLNAPFGARCFPTFSGTDHEDWMRCLNAPFGAQCFPTRQTRDRRQHRQPVSMHLLVLSAFRRQAQRVLRPQYHRLNAPFGAQCFPTRTCTPCTWFTLIGLNAPFGAQCFPTIVVAPLAGPIVSQCTFWCSVLSDNAAATFPNPRRIVSMHLLVLSAFRRRV